MEIQIPANQVIKPAKTFKNRLSKRRISLFLIALPFIVIMFIFCYLPLFGWTYAFFEYQPGVALQNQVFVGFRYFIRMFEPGSTFMASMANTLIFSFLGLLCSPLPIIFALLLGEVKNKRLSKVMQTITSLPNFISWVLVFSIFFAFFNSEGFVNIWLLKLGISDQPIDVLGNEKIVWFFQTAVGIWKTLGWSAILYIAAMSGIDQEMYEAADIDGAGRFRKAWNITIPGLMPTYFVLLLLSVSGMLNNGFEQYYVFRNPMVASKIDVIDIYVYLQGIAGNQYAYATAIGVFKSVVSILLLFSTNFLSKKVRGQSII